MNMENIYIKCQILSGVQVFPGDLNLSLTNKEIRHLILSHKSLSLLSSLQFLLALSLFMIPFFFSFLLLLIYLPIKHVLDSHTI